VLPRLRSPEKCWSVRGKVLTQSTRRGACDSRSVDNGLEQHHGLLDRLPSEELAPLRNLGRRRRWPRGAALLSEGHSSEWVAIITSGRTKISYFTEEGEEVVLAIRGPETLLGELSAIDGGPPSATVTALEPTEAIVISVEDFMSFLESHPKAAVLMLKVLSHRLRDADRKRIEFGSSDTLNRVGRRLVELADRFGQEVDDGVRIDLAMTQEELAGWTGSSREAVSKALRTLRSRGLIDTRRRSITVLDLAALRKARELKEGVWARSGSKSRCPWTVTSPVRIRARRILSASAATVFTSGPTNWTNGVNSTARRVAR
jgi:CRP/FNR family cyclic AMP-dependent transcriptional regulator